jgi:nitroimidazol reductase NimA-like FMN-containing flavoprotein (pyridoxamine 5'-phosphate oxidase superfamily)
MAKGGPELLMDEVAQELLSSTIPARLAYVWRDGTPRVVPIWFEWTGSEIVMASPPRAPKLHVLATGDRVAVSIDANQWPYRALTIRGTVAVDKKQGVIPEYAHAAERYFGAERGKAWVSQFPPDFEMYRIAVRPEVVTLLDFETRFPSALSLS